MNIEKEKEIKKALRYNVQDEFMNRLPYADEFNKLKMVSFEDILTLINELESENEKVKQHKRELQGGQQDLIKRIAELEGEITNSDIINSKLEMDIELLNKQNIDLEIDRDYYQEQFNEQEDFYVEWNKQQLKQFAERLKEKLFDLGNVVNEEDIDETLKEFIDT